MRPLKKITVARSFRSLGTAGDRSVDNRTAGGFRLRLGQINGKYAIFLLGYDNSQPWAIYLLQSN
jgi:hypothetical protein